MSRLKLRESIATEAARLVLRGKETQYASARKRAARWLSRRKLGADDMPSDAEIHSKLYALAGFFSAEQQQTALASMRRAALDVMHALAPFDPRIHGCAVDGPVMIGSEIALDVRADSVDDVVAALGASGFRARRLPEPEKGGGEESSSGITRLRVNHIFPCELTVIGTASGGLAAEAAATAPQEARLSTAELRDRIEQTRQAAEAIQRDETAAPEDGYHPDTFAMLRVLLGRLEEVQLDPSRHPEGDALYHSLQVYELGLAERPYDEEFLLACLLHDAGLGIDRRDPVPAALSALRGLLTERTCFLIEHRSAAREYLKTGKAPRSLRRSEHFDDLVLLAQCDLQGRVRGADVSSPDEALGYLERLDTAWDEV